MLASFELWRTGLKVVFTHRTIYASLSFSFYIYFLLTSLSLSLSLGFLLRTDGDAGFHTALVHLLP